VAVGYVGRVRDSVDVFPLLRWVLAEDRASSVRCAAADAMRQLQDARGIEPLRAAAQTYDVYVRRACGRALAELGQVEGIQLLISSLSFPSIDAFYNYDRNVPNYVSAYCGLDLPDPDRYVQAKWQEWFDAHRDSIDLGQNVAAFRSFTAVSDSVRDSSGMVQAARYAALNERFPQSERIRKALAAKLNEVAWGMVTGVKSDVRTGLDYARRAVELDPDPNYWDTLIEAYLANGRKAQALVTCQAALARYPDNQMLKDRLKQCEER
jgi:tetratricopeptide (TPR) repeat protein